MCYRILEIARADIDDDVFPDGFGVRRVLDDIMAEAHEALLYRRHRQSIGGLMIGEVDERLSDTH